MKLFSSLFFTLLFQLSFANNFYISPNGNDKTGNGSINNPWQSLFQASIIAQKPGDIIHVLPGTYVETLRSQLALGVSIEGENANKCIIQSTLTEQFKALIVATSPEGTLGNQHISNITLDGSNRKTSWAIEIRGRSNFIINNCIIKDFEESGIIWTGRTDNIDAAPEKYATGNKCYNNTIKNSAKYDGFGRGCLTIGAQQGMLIYNNTISQVGREKGTNGWPIKYANDGFLKGLKIYNNKIYKEPYEGTSWDFALELFNVSGLEIYNNTIVGAIDLNHQFKGEYKFSIFIHNNILGQEKMNSNLENGIIMEYSTDEAIITKNEMRNLGVPVMFSCRSASKITNVSITNNNCTNIGVSDGSHQGFAVRFVSDGSNNHYIENLNINNNKFIGSEKQQPYWGIGILNAALANNIKITNNTLQNFSAGAIVANPANTVDTLIISNNILSNNGNGNKPAFTNGNPKNLIVKKNQETNAKIISFANFKMNVVKPFYEGIKNTTMIEYIAVIAGILSVWFSRKEHIYVFPLGLISTIIYIFLSFEQSLFGEASVNFYYTIMSIWGWMIWSKKDKKQHRVVRVTKSTTKEWITQIIFFAAFFVAIYFALVYAKKAFYSGVIPWADAFASATAFTGMWLMTKKKVESWYWWIATNIASIPLYFVKHYVVTSVYYCVLLAMAFWGLQEWKRKSTRRRIRSTEEGNLATY